MTQRSDEITMENPSIVHGFSYRTHSNATAILVNRQKNIIQHRSSSNRSRSGLRASSNRDRIRCLKCREYDHFAKDCLNSQTEKEPEQIEQMYS